MKVMIINGSPHAMNGTCGAAIDEIVSVFNEEGIESVIYNVGTQTIRGCLACGVCHKTGSCVQKDSINEMSKCFEESDGMIVVSPVYFASANGTLVSCLDRLFYSSRFDKSMKVGASVACARRGGIETTFEELNKYFTISQMPVVSSVYWNGLFGNGNNKEEVKQDQEGLHVMHVLAKNMAFLMKSIALGKEKYGLPENGKKKATNFIR